MATVKHFIQIFFDEDREDYQVSRKWVENRWNFFIFFTYNSLRRQTRWGEFEILLLCGQKHKEFTSKLELPEHVRIVYDRGHEVYQENANGPWFRHNDPWERYVAITRIDSDDLMAPDAMAEVMDVTRKSLNKTGRACLIFRKNLQWNIHNEFVGPHYRQAPPFVTHIFPAALILLDWKRFLEEHYVQHGNAGGRNPNTIELGKHKILVVKHTANISVLKRKGKVPFLTEAQKISLIADDDRIQIDLDRVRKALEPFVVDFLDANQQRIRLDIEFGFWTREAEGVEWNQ